MNIFNTPKRQLKRMLKRTNGAVTAAGVLANTPPLGVLVIADGKPIKRPICANAKSGIVESFCAAEDGGLVIDWDKRVAKTETKKHNKVRLIAFRRSK